MRFVPSLAKAASVATITLAACVLAPASPGLFISGLSPSALAQDANLPPAELRIEAVPQVLARAVDDVIRPGYHTFQTASEALGGAMTTLCAAPSQTALDGARSRFAEAVAAWSRIEIIRIGPVIEANRFERILFYPDRKGTGLRQVQAALAAKDETATSVGSLRDKSVAMQGLGALEFLLSGTGNEQLLSAEGDYRCRYGQAVAENLVRLATELTTAWDAPDGVQAAWKSPGPDNPEFRDEREAVSALLGILVHGAETVRDQRIESFYRGGNAKPAPRSAIYWRSGLTFASIEGNLAGLQSLLDGAGMQDLLDPEVRSIVGSIDFVLKSLIKTSGELDRETGTDIERAVSEEAMRAKLEFLLLNSRDLIVRLNDGYGGAIGLGAGFSFSDGD